MLTLTYPGDWLAVAPSNEVVRRHVRLLEKRWNREWGVWADASGKLRANPFVATWKREFQARGAPHYHYLVAPPESPDFPQWLSETWADIVGSDWCGHACWTVWKGGDNYVEVAPAGKGDPCCERGRHVMAGTGIDYREGARAVDPRRLAVYFAKHGAYGAKEYQNEAPAEWLENGGAGRFWGVIGLSAAVAAVEVDPVTAQAVARILRRLEYSKRYRQQLRILRCKCHTRVDKTTGELPAKHRQACFRWNTVVVRRFRGSLGYVIVNDAPSLAAGLARAVERSTVGHGVRRSGGPPLGFLP
jgi:hypothetical protein